MVHRRAQCLLISYETDDANTTRHQIASGGAIALDNAISAVTIQFDDLIKELSSHEFIMHTNRPYDAKAHVALTLFERCKNLLRGCFDRVDCNRISKLFHSLRF